MTNTVSIIIVNWNTGSLLRECCQSIARSDFSDIELREVIVVDNASTDGSALDLGLPACGLKIINNQTNQGFATACNQGASLATGNFLLFLNPDTRLFEGTLRETHSFMSSPLGADVGICGVRLEDDTAAATISFADFPTAMGIFRSALGLSSSLGNTLPTDVVPLATVLEVDQVIGAYFFMRSQLFRQLGGFDERFFVYFEEVDLSLRARHAGWRSVCLLEVSAVHSGGGSSRHVKAHRLYYFLRSRLLYAFKHFSRLERIGVVFTTFCVEVLTRVVIGLVRFSWSGLSETLVAFALLLRWLPQWVFKGVTR